MHDTPRPSLEQALSRTEADVDSAIRAAASALRALKGLKTLVHEGNLRDLQPAFEATQQALDTLRQQVANTRDGWDFDEETYFGDSAYKQELLDTAGRLNLQLFQQDDQLYCYPTLVQLLPRERAVLVDRKRERRIRPSVLVERLRTLQNKRPRFRAADFLESLFQAYELLVKQRGAGLFPNGQVERLIDIYRLLVLLPGQSREYSRQEFARDLYLLDQSGVTTTRGGYELTFSASRGPAGDRPGTLRVVTQTGGEKPYWGIAFRK